MRRIESHVITNFCVSKVQPLCHHRNASLCVHRQPHHRKRWPTHTPRSGSPRLADSEESAFDLKSAFVSVRHTSHWPPGSPSDVSMCSWWIRRQSPSFRPIALAAASKAWCLCIVTWYDGTEWRCIILIFVLYAACHVCCSSYLSEEAEDVGVASDAIRVLLQVILQHNTSDVHTLYTRTCTSYNSQNAKIAALMCPCNRTQYHIYREPPAERVFTKKIPHHSYNSRALTNQKHCVQSGVFLWKKMLKQ